MRMLVLKSVNNMPQENDDATKVRKRQNGIDAVMRTPAYIITKLYYDEEIQTPDPNDLKLSKRQWEQSMMKRRADLKTKFHELCKM